MLPLNIWVTRPHSHEILMGGVRHLKLWLDEPSYMHTHQSESYGSEKIKVKDRGWSAGNTSSIDIKPLMKQDPALYKVIWDYVYWSVGPRGLTIPEIDKWESIVTSGTKEDEFYRTNWDLLLDDREWEAKCNVCHKRFLLKVDLRTNTVERIIPKILHYRTPENPKPEWEQTDQCSAKLAVEYFHELTDDALPF